MKKVIILSCAMLIISGIIYAEKQSTANGAPIFAPSNHAKVQTTNTNNGATNYIREQKAENDDTPCIQKCKTTREATRFICNLMKNSEKFDYKSCKEEMDKKYKECISKC